MDQSAFLVARMLPTEITRTKVASVASVCFCVNKEWTDTSLLVAHWWTMRHRKYTEQCYLQLWQNFIL